MQSGEREKVQTLSGTFRDLGVSMQAVQAAQVELTNLMEALIKGARLVERLSVTDPILRDLLAEFHRKARNIVGDAIARTVQENINARVVREEEEPPTLRLKRAL